MKYVQPTFTLPVSSHKVSQARWDAIFKDAKRRELASLSASPCSRKSSTAKKASSARLRKP
jgi:hypothetical protein